MATEHDLRRKRKLLEPVALQTTTPEEEAAVQREQDLIPQLPTSAEDLLAATFGEAGSSGLTELQTRFVRDDAALLAGHAVEQRLRRYLFEGETTVPSRFARALVAAVHDVEQLTLADRRTLAELQFYLVSELNPLLQQWQAAVQPHSAEVNLLETLSYGTVERDHGQREQRTVSVIGLLHQLSQTDPEFVPIQLETAVHPQHLVVERPFSDGTTEYWKQRVQCAELYHATEPNELIGWRTRHLQTVLEEAIEATPESDPNHEQIVEAYDTMISWLDVHAEAMEKPLRIDESDVDRATFDYFVSRMDFTHGDTNDVIAVLNAAEVIKQHNPELFMRMAGIAPNTLTADQEARRSDLFGSAFHLALYRTLQLDHPRFKIIHQQVQQLTQMDAPATPLVRLNGEQVRQIASKFQEAALANKPDKMLITMIATTFAGLIARHPREVALALMVNSVEQDSRTETLERLKKVGAHDFYAMIKGAPAVLLDDPAYIEVVRQRLNLKSGLEARQQIEFIGDWKHYREYNWDLKTALWITADDAALLTEDFWKYLDEARTYLYNHDYLPRHYDRWNEHSQQVMPLDFATWQADQRQEKHAELEMKLLNVVRQVVDAHLQISKTQWLEWYRNTKGLPGKGTADAAIDPDGKREMLQALAAKMYRHRGSKPTEFCAGSFGVLLGPEASRTFDSLGGYNPSRDTSDIEKAISPAVGTALRQRQLIEATVKAKADGTPEPPREEGSLVGQLRASYRLLSTEQFMKRYREALVRLGADYIMELRNEASEADFAELVEQLYFPPNTPKLSTRPEHGSGYLATAVQYPDLILASNPWQLEVYDALDTWVNKNPAGRTACRAELDKVAQEFLTRTDMLICDYHDNSTGQRTGFVWRDTPLTVYRDVRAPDVVSWQIVEERGSGRGSNYFSYNKDKREIVKP